MPVDNNPYSHHHKNFMSPPLSRFYSNMAIHTTQSTKHVCMTTSDQHLQSSVTSIAFVAGKICHLLGTITRGQHLA